MDQLTVVVLAGGLSHEREVSLRSGRRVAADLRDVGATVVEWDADTTLLERLRRERPDAVVIALHGGEGENGSVQAVLEMLEVPFVGTNSWACRRAWDKPIAKAELARGGLHTPDWIVLPHAAFRELGARAVLEAIVHRLGLPLMIKPDQGGSALGAQVVREVEMLPAAMVDCLAYGNAVLAERYVEGVEVAVSVCADPSPRALPVVEICPKDGVYDYTARYTPGATTFHCPARLSAPVADAAARAALEAHRLLGMRDLSRTDAIITPDGTAWILDVNVSPGLTDTSLLPTAVSADGGHLGELFSTLLTEAIQRSGLDRSASLRGPSPVDPKN
ncbi:D-alanine--D-alanine ligase [Pseudonocardia eucalypti]|uniref:D-alanine--D-alanine ligase n=1 Tax=Pseudonocardia eucalypti TaxID=648755 RepID=UPI00161D9489